MNVTSILLGLVSLVFAIHALQVRGCLICCTASLGTCGGALLCQLWELNRLAQIMDASAIYDTVRARCLAGSVLLALNLALHGIALLRGRKKTCGNC